MSVPDENTDLNERELREGRAALASTPSMITIGTHNACNAKCVFCLEGKYSQFSLKVWREFFEARMGNALARAAQVTFTGFGEVLWLPDTEPFLDHLNATLPRALKIFTTNGTPLRPGVRDLLMKGKYLVRVSLHASRSDLHEELTLLPGQFDAILDNVRALTAHQPGVHPDEKNVQVTLVTVLTTMNVEDLPDFLRLAWDLRVDRVRAPYVTMFQPQHVPMSCYFDQERSNRALRAAKALVPELQAREPGRFFKVYLPPAFGDPVEHDAEDPEEPIEDKCGAPWRQIYVDTHGSTLPCCFWGRVEADLNKVSLDDVWNGPFYRELRRAMASGDPLPTCRTCVRFRKENVNDLSCHITSRPEHFRAVMDEIRRRQAGAAAARAVTEGRPALAPVETTSW